MAFSESTKTPYVFGGRTPSGPANTLYRLTPESFQWVRITAGGGPSARDLACMVPAYNGTKLIVYGGSVDGIPLHDIFIYNVANATWSQGLEAGPGHARAGHVCAVSGDALIVWGGFSVIEARTPPDQIMAVYNLTSNKWMPSYISPTGEQDPNLISRPTETSGSGDSTGLIVGCLFAAVALAALGFVLWRQGVVGRIWTKFFPNVRPRQDADDSHNYMKPVENNEGAQIGPNGQANRQADPQAVPPPALQLENGARNPREANGAYDAQQANGVHNPQLGGRVAEIEFP
ncbi:hypothetical protein BGZ74_002802 [Mortierella antarctica]|nr:hypothetical protein BGZ74_002802 [Mortierella antarctica]